MLIAIGLATGARPEAITDLTLEQLDFENRLIRLLPAGRAQNKKRRPTVKMPEALARYIEENMVTEFKSTRRHVTGITHLVNYRGKKVSRLDTSWSKMLEAAGIEDVTPYSPRATVARWLTMEGVPIEQVARLLGHRIQGYDVTSRYIGHQPEYLKESCAALDKLLFLCLDANQLQTSEELHKPASILGSEEINQVQSDARLAQTGQDHMRLATMVGLVVE
jgi:integrase